MMSGMTSGYGEARVLRRLSLSIAKGQIVAVIGRNGMGKSTLLKSLMGFLPKTEGDVRILDRDVTRWPPNRIARLGVAYVAQEQALFPELTVEENIRLALPGSRVVTEALGIVETVFPFLLKKLRQRAGTLSGGEQKMLLVARSLSTGAKLLLIDEISEGLQPSVVERVASVLGRQCRDQGATTLLIEQNLPFALAVADSYAVLDGGEFVKTGSAHEPSATEHIANYLTV
jgi:urea transport system ATP-binding protein